MAPYARARRCLELIAQCRERGAVPDGPEGWRAHLARGVAHLVDGRVVIAGSGRIITTGHGGLRVAGGGPPVRLGWPSASQEAHWLRYLRETPIEHRPEHRVVHRLASGARDHAMITPARALGGRRAWLTSDTFNLWHRPAGLDDSVLSIVRSPTGDVHSLWVHRGVDQPELTHRDRWAIGVVHSGVARMLGRELAQPGEPSPAGLAPRLRRALDRLLAGDSEKMAACALGVSRATVHEYIQDIYSHFGVRSRGELAARLHSRRVPHAQPSQQRGSAPAMEDAPA